MRSVVVKMICTDVALKRRWVTETAWIMAELEHAGILNARTAFPPVTLDGCSSAVSCIELDPALNPGELTVEAVPLHAVRTKARTNKGICHLRPRTMPTVDPRWRATRSSGSTG